MTTNNTLRDIEEAVREVMGKDPIEMVINYYKGLIRLSADVIAEEQKRIHSYEKRIQDLSTNKEGEEQ